MLSLKIFHPFLFFCPTWHSYTIETYITVRCTSLVYQRNNETALLPRSMEARESYLHPESWKVPSPSLQLSPNQPILLSQQGRRETDPKKIRGILGTTLPHPEFPARLFS